jgi:hypothetical protein
LVYLSILLFPNSHIILFWEFYFLPFSVHARTNVIFVTLLSLLWWVFYNCINFSQIMNNEYKISGFHNDEESCCDLPV